jgi:TRAP-type mannitol/chloroaromatic compound transport system substrate-binding protein
MRHVKLHRPIATAAVAGLLGVAIASAAQAQDRVRWQVPIAFASTLTALGDTLPWVAEQIEKMSDGSIQMIVAEPGKVVPALGIFDAVSEGKIEAGYSWMGYEQGKVPASALFGARPFGFEPDEYAAWYYFAGGNELVKELYAPHNIYPIFCGTISPEAAGWFRFEIENLDQVKGLKFRAAGLGGKVMEKVGASVTVLPGGELYQALERGVLDGTEFSLPTVDEQLGFYQIAKHYYLPGWHQPSTNQFLYVNLDVWNGLGPETQGLIEMACMAGNAHAIAKGEALQGAVLKRFEDEGVTLHTYDDETLKAFYDATKTVMERKSAENEQFGKVYASMMAFQEELTPWTEKGYLPRNWLSEHVYNATQ